VLRETRLILMTTLARRGDASRMKEAGFSAYLPKPIKQSELRDCLTAVLGAGAEGKEEATAPLLGTWRPEMKDQPGRFRILLAEDNVTNQKVALGILGKMGFRADAVANGREVVEALGTLPYDLVFMDVQMPVLDGFEATRLIRSGESKALNPSVPVIAMTALADERDRARCLDAGMNDCLSKPISPQAVAAVLEKWLGLGE
jgi:CheY-like chemotaxis protein